MWFTASLFALSHLACLRKVYISLALNQLDGSFEASWMFKKKWFYILKRLDGPAPLSAPLENGCLCMWPSNFNLSGHLALPNVGAYFQMWLDTCVQHVQDSQTLAAKVDK